MKILITGATGFIGKRLLLKLERARKNILVLAQTAAEAQDMQQRGFSVVTGDMENISGIVSALKTFQPQVCIHLAWQGIPDFSSVPCLKNLNLAVSFLDVLVQETSCRKIIITGSCFEYGATKGACKETDDVNINSYFAWAKGALYKYARLLCEKNGRHLYWARLFYVYGPGQRPGSLIPSLTNALRQGIVPDIRTPLNGNDFIFVDDVADGLAKMAAISADPGVYNLGSGVSTKVLDVCRLVEERIRGNSDLTNQVGKRGSKEESMNFWADLSKSKQALGWEPRMTLERGIQECINSLEVK